MIFMLIQYKLPSVYWYLSHLKQNPKSIAIRLTSHLGAEQQLSYLSISSATTDHSFPRTISKLFIQLKRLSITVISLGLHCHQQTMAIGNP